MQTREELREALEAEMRAFSVDKVSFLNNYYAVFLLLKEKQSNKSPNVN